MSTARPRRVCIAPSDIASYYAGLATGFRALGIPCWFFCFDVSPYGRYRPAPDAFWLERWIFALALGARPQEPAPLRLGRRVLLRLLRFLACGWSMLACDVFVFSSGRTFLWGFELPLLRWLGRTVICVFNGSDTRPPWMSGFFALGPGTPDPDRMLAEIQRQQRMLRWFERWASAFVCHPLSAQLLRRPFINHLELGHPCTPAAIPPATVAAGRALRIVHAPSQPLQKGSSRFRAIVEQLRREGREIEFTELTGRPNHEVLAAIANSDLVLDETYSDIPFAGLGTEAAWAGKPAVVGGYGRSELIRYAGESGLRLDLFVPPEELEATVRRLVDDPQWRAERGRAAQHFIRTWSPEAVARGFVRIANGTAPAAWSIDPATLTYWQGWGAPEASIQAAIGALVQRHGAASLGLSHNPDLERRLATRARPVESADVATPVR